MTKTKTSRYDVAEHLRTKRDGVFTPLQRFWRGGMTGIAPKFKRLGRVE